MHRPLQDRANFSGSIRHRNWVGRHAARILRVERREAQRPQIRGREAIVRASSVDRRTRAEATSARLYRWPRTPRSSRPERPSRSPLPGSGVPASNPGRIGYGASRTCILDAGCSAGFHVGPWQGRTAVTSDEEHIPRPWRTLFHSRSRSSNSMPGQNLQRTSTEAEEVAEFKSDDRRDENRLMAPFYWGAG
jgi:hypothetical protein